jgi:hypothetical protein
MACSVRVGILAVSLAIALFSTSCEMHPIGQMPDVQSEQPDPAREWSEASKKNSYESSSRETPAEVPHEGR